MPQGFLQIFLFLAIIVAFVPVLGGYMARVFTGETVLLSRVFGPLERLIYKLLRVNPAKDDQSWKAYAGSLILFSAAGWFLLYLILRTQTIQPFNPAGFHSGTWDVSFSTASSFVANTNWQYYGGETTLSYFSQMSGLAVQNFMSAAVGISVAVALIRGLVARKTGGGLGSFWVDITRATLYVLLPIAFIGALVLVSQGVLQTLGAGNDIFAAGPVGSQEVIKFLGTNGGGFFNVNSSMPFENPTGFTDMFEIGLMLIIPASMPYTFGKMIGNRRQGWAIFGAMAAMFIVSVTVIYIAEQHGTPAQHLAGVSTQAVDGSTGGNLEGSEQRFGITGTALMTAVTTATSTGGVNSALESLSGIGGLVPMANMSASETIFGGVGTGLYSMLLFALLAVFIGGLMVGRTPEFLGKKIEAREIKLVVLGTLVTPLAVLISTGLAVGTKYGAPSVYAEGPQGFSESLYAYLSQANNNGSAFAGYTGYYQPEAGNIGAHGITFADLLGGITMLGARFLPILFVLAIAGSLAKKRVAPAGLGTMRTDTPTFVFLLIGVVVLIGALTFFPALLLGPVVQGLTTRLF